MGISFSSKGVPFSRGDKDVVRQALSSTFPEEVTSRSWTATSVEFRGGQSSPERFKVLQALPNAVRLLVNHSLGRRATVVDIEGPFEPKMLAEALRVGGRPSQKQPATPRAAEPVAKKVAKGDLPPDFKGVAQHETWRALVLMTLREKAGSDGIVSRDDALDAACETLEIGPADDSGVRKGAGRCLGQMAKLGYLEAIKPGSVLQGYRLTAKGFEGAFEEPPMEVVVRESDFDDQMADLERALLEEEERHAQAVEDEKARHEARVAELGARIETAVARKNLFLGVFGPKQQQ
jgi:hypothetical protein